MVAADILNVGASRGHSFSISSIRPSKKLRIDPTADFDLIVDLFNYPATFKSFGAWRDFSPEFKSKILERENFVHLTNAYSDVCNLPYLPCSGNSSPICKDKSKAHIGKNFLFKDFGGKCFSMSSEVRDFFVQSKLNVFVSPMHRDVSLKILNVNNLPPSYVMKPTIDTGLFYNKNYVRDIDYLFIGVIGEAKGFFEMRKYFANSNIHLAGNISPGITLDFGVYHGHIPYHEVPDLMNRAKNFVFLPRWPEPQGRVVIEAALCGCNLIVNNMVGAVSFPFRIDDPKNYESPVHELWDRIEQAI